MPESSETIANSRLINLLSSLSAAELKKLSYESSRTAEEGKRAEKCLVYILSFSLKNAAKILKTDLFHHVYGKTEFKESTLRNLLSDVYEHVLQFLGRMAYEKSIFRPLFVLQELEKRGLDRETDHLLERLVSELKLKSDDELYPVASFMLNWHMNISVLKRKFSASKENLPDHRLNDQFINMTLLVYSRLISASANLASCIGGYEPIPFNPFLKKLSESIPEISYETAVRIRLSEALPDFKDISKAISAIEQIKKPAFHHLPKAVRQELGVYVMNLISYNYVRNPDAFAQSYIETSEMLMRENLLLNDGRIPGQMYSDYTLLVFRHNNPEKAWRFMEDNRKLLVEDEEDFWYYYTHSTLLFHEKKYKESLKQLSLCKPFYFGQKLRARSLYLKIYYEKGEHDALLSLANSFKHFLNNNPDLPDGMRSGSIRFLRCIKHLTLLRKESKRITREEVRNEIENLPPASNKFWLLDMLNAISDKEIAKKKKA